MGDVQHTCERGPLTKDKSRTLCNFLNSSFIAPLCLLILLCFDPGRVRTTQSRDAARPLGRSGGAGSAGHQQVGQAMRCKNFSCSVWVSAKRMLTVWPSCVWCGFVYRCRFADMSPLRLEPERGWNISFARSERVQGVFLETRSVQCPGSPLSNTCFF